MFFKESEFWLGGKMDVIGSLFVSFVLKIGIVCVLKIICMIAWCYEIVINFNSKYMNFVVVYVYFISIKNSHILFFW